MLNYAEDKTYGNNRSEIIEGKRQFIFSQFSMFKKVFDNKREEIKQRDLEAFLAAKMLASIVKEDMASNSAINAFVGHDADKLFSNAILFCDKKLFDKFSKEEQKNCSESYKTVETVISNLILNNDKDFKMDRILKIDDGSAYFVQYDYKGMVVTFSIPVFENATDRNFESFVNGYGVFVPNPTKENTIDPIAFNIDYTQVIKSFYQWYEQKHPTVEHEAMEENQAPKAVEKKAKKAN